MRVLMVAPHPVYSPRGTPISVFNRCLALCALGHEVDLVTYPVGEDRPVAGLRYLRAAVPGVHSVAVGPSLRKLVLNGAVTLRSFKEAARGRGRYDVVHTHEEAGLFGPALAAMAGVPHVYDMGNDWSDVLCNYGAASARNPITRLAGALESSVIRHSDAVITHFPLIADRVAATTGTPVETVFNISLDAEPDPAVASAIRRSWAPEGSKVILYSGTLEPYQGVQLLLESMTDVARTHPHAVLVVVGGQERTGRGAAAAGRGARDLRHRPSGGHAAGDAGPRLHDGGRRPGVPPRAGAQHAAQDLLLPALGSAHRGHRHRQPHPGAHQRLLRARATDGRRPGPGHLVPPRRRPDPHPGRRGGAAAAGRLRD